MRRLSSETRLMKVPSFFHSIRAGVVASLCAEQLSSAALPRMANVSWGSTVNQKGLKGCAAEPRGQKSKGEILGVLLKNASCQVVLMLNNRSVPWLLQPRCILLILYYFTIKPAKKQKTSIYSAA